MPNNLDKRDMDLNKETDVKDRMRKGVGYLVLSIVIILLLLWFLPSVLNIDIAKIMSGDKVVGVLRIGLGLFLIAGVFSGIKRMINVCTLEGETWREGFRNAFMSSMISRDLITILLLLAGGVALVMWGFNGLM